MYVAVVYSNNFSRAAQLYRDKIANQATVAQKMYGMKVCIVSKWMIVVLLY